MCGIAGIISAAPRDLRLIQEMTEIQTHRGPDGGALLFAANNGTYTVPSNTPQPHPVIGNAALGHRRLAIIDRSDNGAQPMHSKTSGCWISFNGELYNYKELRTELQQQGCRFSTESDTEVILRAYEQWGPHCFPRFLGMWALAIYDPAENRLVLSRDRFGIKPLHYTLQEGFLAFASEIKALLSLPGVTRQANLPAIKSYLSHQLVNHTNETFFSDILAFPPAHYALIPLDSATLPPPVRYWDYPDSLLELAYGDAQKEFRSLFTSALNQHMRSDVPVGSCLSGGLDSSAIVGAAEPMVGQQHKPFHTFTAIFPDKEIDETIWVNAVNERTNSTPHWTTPDANALVRDFDYLVWHQEEPFTSASMYAQWCVMRTARENAVPVLLDGQGADEILCGYKKFYILYLITLWKGRHIKRALTETFHYLRNGDRTVWRIGDLRRYLPKYFRRDLSLLQKLETIHFAATSPLPSPGIASARSVQERQVQDLGLFSLPALLRFEDRNSMAFSIESRVPFLDHRLVEFCLKLPVSMKLKNGTSKRIMRDALKDIIPPAILARRDKMGFGAPEKRWLKEAIAAKFIADMEAGDFHLSPLIEATSLKEYLRKTQISGDYRQGRLLFQLFTLNRWAKCFSVHFNHPQQP